MKRLYTLLALLMCTTLTFAQLTLLKRATPEEEGLSSKDVLAYLDTVMRQTDSEMHGVMMLRNGHVIAEKYNEPFEAKYSHTLYSCSKTFTGVAVGLAIEDSLLHLTDKLVDFFPDMLPEVVSDSLAAITVEDLLTMTSGLPVDTKMRARELEWVKFYLQQKMVAWPGKKYAYDSISSYLLSAIVQKVEGMNIFDLLNKRIFMPLGITQVAWEESPEGVSCGGWGLYMQLESMAKFGQLLLQKGMWDGKQLVSAEWVEEMCKHHSTNAGGGKYGYHIWVTNYPGMVRADGAYGQYIFIIPDKKMVVAMTQCQRVSTLTMEQSELWKLSRKASAKALAADTKSYKDLRNARYRLTPTRGKATTIRHLTKTKVKLIPNDLNWQSIEFNFKQMDKKQLLTAKVTTYRGETFNLQCGYQRWITNELQSEPLNFRPFKGNFCNITPPFYTAASYGWTTDSDLYLRLQYVNWLTSCRVHFRFTTNGVVVELLNGYTKKSLKIQASLE